MQVEVDTHDRSGERLPQVARSVPVYATDVFGSLDSIADERVKTIIAANEGGATHVAQGPCAARRRGRSAISPALRATRDAVAAHRPAL